MPPPNRDAQKATKRWKRMVRRLELSFPPETDSPNPLANMRTKSPLTPQENFPTLKDPSAREPRDPALMESSLESLTQQQDELNAELTGLAFEKLTVGGETTSQQQHDAKEDKVKEIRKKLAAVGRELQVREEAKSPAGSDRLFYCGNCRHCKRFLDDGTDDDHHREWLISGRG